MEKEETVFKDLGGCHLATVYGEVCNTFREASEREMYNHELKSEFASRFVEQKPMYQVVLHTFAATEPYEREANKDICEFDTEDLGVVLTNISGARKGSVKTRGGVISRYCNWCIEKGIPNAHNVVIEATKIVGNDKIKTTMVANPQHLQRWLDSVFDPENKNGTDCTLRCYCWLAYSGIKEGEDACKVRVSDIDFENMLIRFGGKEYPIYTEALPAFKKCATLKRFTVIRPNQPGGRPVYKVRGRGNNLLRGEGEMRNAQTMRGGIAKKKREQRKKDQEGGSEQDENILNLNLSYERVWLSGLFYRTAEKEIAGIEPDFRPMVEEDAKNAKKDYTPRVLNERIRDVAKAYVTDYERWKEAFGIKIKKRIKKEKEPAKQEEVKIMRTIRLTDEAYIRGYEGGFLRAVTKEGKPSAEGIFGQYYFAHAEDENGGTYRVYWKIRDDFDLENDPDESNACDWEFPYMVIEDSTGKEVADEVRLKL